MSASYVPESSEAPIPTVQVPCVVDSSIQNRVELTSTSIERNPSSSRSGPPRPSIAFISGPLDVDEAYFTRHYAPRILSAIANNHLFILGPSRGTDTLALHFLRTHNVPASRIRIYLNHGEEPKLRSQQAMRAFEKAGGGVVVVRGGHEERDGAMTRASHYDILRYRTEEECKALYGLKYRKRVSGTEKNKLRRAWHWPAVSK